MSVVLVAFAGSLVLAGFHAFTRPLERLPRRYQAFLASLAGGAGLAYVFLYLLFELATEGAPKIHELAPLGPEPLETLFILLLAALSATYLAQLSLERTLDRRDDHRGYALLFLTYNFLAGAGLLEEAIWGPLNLSFYVAAIGLHLLFNERFLVHLSPSAHTWHWRIALAAAPVLGFALAAALQIPVGVLYAVLAIVAGGTIITALRRELPDPHGFRLTGFLAGVLGYAGLIFTTWRF